MRAPTRGRIITFYSYKGGTGRSMALANVAWILASNGMRVLAIDWDLEGPGLHRYFHPFLSDKDLATSEGVVEFVVDFEAAAKTPPKAGQKPDSDWFLPHTNLLRYAVSLDADVFPSIGTLDFVPAGRQDAGYAVRVNSFNWGSFYRELGGGVFLEAVKNRLRAEYDYIVIDSRTGVSDTSGICTVQMPDDFVVCFTLNAQSIEGASAIAASALAQRQAQEGEPALRIWPVPMRVEMAEKDKLELARDAAHERFDRFLGRFSAGQREDYWGRVEVLYEPFYAYEEVLSTFRDRPHHTKSMLASMEAITEFLTEGRVTRLRRIPEPKRNELLGRYLRQPRRVEAPKAAALVNLAETLRSQGDLAGARKAMEEGVAALRQLLGPTHSEALAAMEKLASMLHDQGDLAGARKLYEELLAVRRETLGPEHPDTLTCMTDLAATLQAQGDLDASRQLQEQALEAFRRVLGPEHPGIAASLSNLASTLHTQGDLAGARRLQEEVLEIRQRALGPEHPDTLAANDSLASTLSAKGELARARSLQEEALEIRQRVLGLEHPDTLRCMSNLAGTLRKQGDLTGARKLHEQVLEVRERVLGGPQHPETLGSMSNLAAILREQGDLAMARKLQEEALEASRRVFGTEHPSTSVFAWNLYETLKDLGEKAAARTVLSTDLLWLLYGNPAVLRPVLSHIRDTVSREVAAEKEEGQAHSPIAPSSVLVLGDDPQTRSVLNEGIAELGWTSVVAESEFNALDLLQGHETKILIADLDALGFDSLGVVKRARREHVDVDVVVIASSATMPKAAEAIRLGVPDYLVRPFGVAEVHRVLNRLAGRRLAFGLDGGVSSEAEQSLRKLVGNSPAMEEVRRAVLKVARLRFPVLILGDSGTGKELLARTIHTCSPWSGEAFVAVDCGALTSALLESELFGLLAKGGRGTVLLDEIGELPVELQSKLLRSIQEREIRPLGSNRPVPLAARIVAAANTNMEDAIRQGTFRRDLYYRLNVFTIHLPPLRERKQDILALVTHFLERYGAAEGVEDFSPEFMSCLVQYWPGNVRELENIIQFAVASSSGHRLEVKDLPSTLVYSTKSPSAAPDTAGLDALEGKATE